MKKRRSPILAATVLASLALSLAVLVTPAHAASYNNVYRMYNPNSGEHFYTVQLPEAKHLLQVGWRWEGVGWVAPATSGTPVYRLYNPNAGDHHYTTSVEERDHLVELGWNNEPVGWYSEESSNSKGMLREYNPNAKSGAHNFTTSREEHDYLVGLGWRDESGEGYAWRASNRDAAPIESFSVQSPAWGSLQTVTIGKDANVAKRVDVPGAASTKETRDPYVARVSWSGHTAYLNRMKAEAEQIGSPTEYFLACDYDLCRVTVLERKNGSWEVIKTWNANMGWNTFTGVWHISHKRICDWNHDYFGKGYNDWASCYVESFLPRDTGHLQYVGGKGYDDGQTIHSTGYESTGYDNTGCIGLLWENAKWVYDNAARNVAPSDENAYHGTSQGTTVYVFGRKRS
ncbi:L,D-transpeptidase family protein [Olsenella phocaeensis]|uniref:L,D-transpeptidase family protein n=1 Tax=Olsenella phocaeensis TaxID=1852385 RepID=UPI003A8CF7BC